MKKKPLLNPKIAVTLPPITPKQEKDIIETVYSAMLYCEQANTWADKIATQNHGIPQGIDTNHGRRLYSNDIIDAAKRVRMATHDFIKAVQATGVDLEGLYEISAQLDDGLRTTLREFLDANMHKAKEDSDEN